MPKVLSRKERYFILTLFLIAFGSLISMPVAAYYHFTKSAPAYGGTLTEGLVGAPKYVNPLLAQGNDVDKELSSLIYGGLVKYDGHGKIEGDLADSYQVSDDGLTYTFKLKNNLVWQDGKPITADDVVFTILTIQNADYSSSQRILWQGVDATEADSQTVVFKLKNKYAQFLGNATVGILPKHIWENIKPASFGLSDFNLKPVGSGPYQPSKIRRDSYGNIKSFELTAFDKYNAGRAYISKLVFKFYPSEAEAISGYNNNEIEGLGAVSAQNISSIRFPGQLEIMKLSLPRYFAIFFNQNQSKQLSDKNVRIALSYATDKKEIVDKILIGKGSTIDSPMMPGVVDIPNSVTKYAFDINLANKTLDGANWTYPASSSENHIRQKVPASKGLQPLKLEIKLTTSDWPELVAVANQIKKQWELVGVSVNIEVLHLPELQQAIKDRDYEALLFGEVLAIDADPFSFWHSSQKRDPGLNLSLYDNKDADKLLEEARQTLDRSARFSKYDDFQKIIANDIPAIFLYSPQYLYAQPNKIKGNDTSLISVPSDRFDTINRWYINTKRIRH